MVTSHRRIERSSGVPSAPSTTLPSRPDEAVSVGARRLAAALAESGPRGRDEWLELAGTCQSLLNTVTAVQDMAIAEAARRESIWCEDGTLGETVHGSGRVTLDAADVVAPVIGASHPQAQRRVEQAVRLAAGRVPVPTETRDVPEASGLGRLHEAMGAGHLDGYRAGVIAFELEVAPADVADAIVAALSGHLGDDAATLRRRTRVLLERISPDLVRERAKRARAATGLRRWVAEPGVDEWHGTFPSEDAAAAWAAIDRLAHDLVAAGTCSNVEQARGKALTDLVTGNATIDVQVVLTVPADTGSPHIDAADIAADSTAPPTQHCGSTLEHDSRALPTTDDDAVFAATVLDQSLAADIDDSHTVTTAAPAHTGMATVANSHTVTIAAPADPHVATADDWLTPTATASGHTHAVSGGARTRGHDDDLVQVLGARPSEPLLVRRGWLRDHLLKEPARALRDAMKSRPAFVPCNPLTGARLDPGDHLATDAYRPGDDLAALVRARDGRCRFPGCSVAARFCDLDHVRPWPAGRTAAGNLLTLCRRHHRIKQRPGWRVRLSPDGTATWTDPTGLERTTTPLNALKVLVLVLDPTDSDPQADISHATGAQTRAVGPNGCLNEVRGQTRAGQHAGAELPVWSVLETILSLALEHHQDHGARHDLWNHRTHRRCTSTAALRAGFDRRRPRAPVPDVPPF